METFPFNLFTNKRIMNYAYSCSESIFNKAFLDIKNIYESDIILVGKNAMQWDKELLYKEQYVWVDGFINNIDSNSLKKIHRILKGEFLYSILVPKEIRFNDDLSKADDRYQYAVDVLKPYCENRFK